MSNATFMMRSLTWSQLLLLTWNVVNQTQIHLWSHVIDKFHTDGFYAARIWSQLLQVSTIIGLVITILAIRKEKQPKEI